MNTIIDYLLFTGLILVVFKIFWLWLGNLFFAPIIYSIRSFIEGDSRKSKQAKYWISFISNLPKTMYFNFHYLPLKQAIKLPIIIHNVKFVNCSGRVIIDVPSPKIRRGMIRLGHYAVSIYADTGLVWDNHGGTIIFKGAAKIGNDSFIVIGKHSTVEVGDDFLASSALKLVSYRGIVFGQSTRLGWQCLVMDTNLHPLYDIKKEKFKRASSPIVIGDYNWFGTQCKIMHGVVTPERCIFGMNTVVTRGCEMKSYCVMGGCPVKILTEGVMRIIGQDTEPE